jgi:hypothetical protein
MILLLVVLCLILLIDITSSFGGVTRDLILSPSFRIGEGAALNHYQNQNLRFYYHGCSRIKPLTLKERSGRDTTDGNNDKEEEAAVDAEAIRQMNVDKLCQWLKPKVDDEDWNDVEQVIRTQRIRGKNFLNYIKADWMADGLPLGVADSLVKIAQEVLGSGGPVISAEKNAPFAVSNVTDVNMGSVDSIHGFLVSQMNDPNQFHCVPHVLGETSRSFALSGRDEALKSAARAFKVLSQSIGTTDRIQRKIPVCSGLSGLGKTRMLEEWERIFDLAEIPQTRLGALVLYYNGHMPQPTERLMTIEASFSWRLLHRLFIEGNGDGFAAFMKKRLPKNARDLDLRTTLEIIRSQLITRGDLKDSECLHMFLGIDEYQSIEDVGGVQRTKQGGLLQDLLNTLGDILASPVDRIRLYPMFAGTDFSVMSIASSSKTETIRVPMSLLSASEIEEAIGAVSMGSILLGYSPVRRHLFFFGGVARWATQYIEELLSRMKELRDNEVPSFDVFESTFRQIRDIYVRKWYRSILNQNLLKGTDFLILAAYSVSGRSVGLYFNEEVSWARLQDSSVCLIDDSGAVSIPYALFHLIADWNPNFFVDEAYKAFVLTLKSLIEKVDNLVSDKAPWQLWEVFGAHFHALRINALIILEFREVALLDLFKGALVNGCNQFVRLKPMYVIKAEDKFNDNLEEYVGIKGQYDDKRNWKRNGFVVLNGESGKGVDIFYCLDKSKEEGQIVITDQRKSISGTLGASKVGLLVENARIMSSVVCLFSCFTASSFEQGNIPEDCCFVSYSQTRAYHGAMWVHPAASPCINVNLASRSYLKILFQGPGCDAFCDEILERRAKCKFFSIDDLKEFILDMKKNNNMVVDIREDSIDRIVFS